MGLVDKCLPNPTHYTVFSAIKKTSLLMFSVRGHLLFLPSLVWLVMELLPWCCYTLYVSLRLIAPVILWYLR